MDLDRVYTCPDCGQTCMGYELSYPIDKALLYVCPCCGCVQEEKELERQLGINEEEE